jgi:translation elongation factor EF-Ts
MNTRPGIIHTKTHFQRIGVIFALYCESDALASSKEFSDLAQEIAIQITGHDVDAWSEVLLDAPNVRGQNALGAGGPTIRQMLDGAAEAWAERIELADVVRLERQKV